MPFSHIAYTRQYTADDWQLMTDAHRRASAELGRHPKNHPHSNRLARAVMRFFDNGVRDVRHLVDLSVESERENITVAAERDGWIPAGKSKSDASNEHSTE